ncbi:sugar kinase [Mesorhizobium sp. CAU 1732]|uniref:sugar kinase n=1 Tax=Mesorhizobium sp. CAU 1732 TaxID=3140358 RepID=UPI00326182EA
MKGIASIGECMLELSGGGADWRMGHAGDTFNTLWALRALCGEEYPTDYVSAFGDDPFSAQQLAFFAENGIGTASSPRIAGARPGLYAITLDGAERSFTYWRADAAARRLADDPADLAKSLENRALVYFSGITLAILDDDTRSTMLDAIATARSAGSKIAFDPNYRARLWASPEAARKALDDALRVVDIALPTFPDEQMLYGDKTQQDTARRMHAAGVGEIVVKDGSEPALVSADNGEHTLPAVHVANPIDTTGAGDSFNGGYLAARLLGHEPVEAAKCAHTVAAAVVQVRGALAPFETLQSAFRS